MLQMDVLLAKQTNDKDIKKYNKDNKWCSHQHFVTVSLILRGVFDMYRRVTFIQYMLSRGLPNDGEEISSHRW